ncbi:hypothetical protein PUN28_008098 [Cardiocondyla obscurior]|uniref:Uncharacterized protein n=1 Tax=Cardiocondyla obscurior TaxID=286306 RepID=A0AAW2FZK3_9HYME
MRVHYADNNASGARVVTAGPRVRKSCPASGNSINYVRALNMPRYEPGYLKPFKFLILTSHLRTCSERDTYISVPSCGVCTSRVIRVHYTTRRFGEACRKKSSNSRGWSNCLETLEASGPPTKLHTEYCFVILFINFFFFFFFFS